MNSLFSWLPADGWQRLLLDALWQSTLIGAIGWLAARFFVRHAAARAWLLFITLTACAVAPLASVVAREHGWTLLTAEQESARLDTNAPPTAANLDAATLPTKQPAAPGAIPIGFHETNGAIAIDDSEAPAKPLTKSKSDSIASTDLIPVRSISIAILSLVGIAWLCASAVLAFRLLFSFASATKLLRHSQACHDETLLNAADEAARRIGMRRPAELLVSDRIATPMVFAFRRPRLIVPSSGLGGSTSSSTNADGIDWNAAFTHELAHIIRGDGWGRLWAELVLIALPLSPLVWLLRRSFRIACEEACDDWVLATGTDAADFAITLTHWVNRRPQPASLAAIGMSTTKSRVLRLLSMRARPVVSLAHSWRWLGAAVTLCSVAGLAMAQAKGTRAAGKPAPPAAQSAPTAAASSPAAAVNDALEKALAEDGLIAVYKDRINDPWLKPDFDEAQRELEAIQSGKKEADAKRESELRETIDNYKKAVKEFEDRIEHRKVELRARLEEQLREEYAAIPKRAGQPNAANSVQPGDTVTIWSSERLIPKRPALIAPFDDVNIDVIGTATDRPIKGTFKVDSSGEVVLGPGYGTVKLAGLTRREAEHAVKTKLGETLANPEVAVTIADTEARWTSLPPNGKKVDDDGTLNLGPFGKVSISGLSEAEAIAAIKRRLNLYFRDPEVDIKIAGTGERRPVAAAERNDVTPQSNAVGQYYVMLVYADDDKTPGSGQVLRFVTTGSETVLDAIAQIEGLSNLAEAKIWINRPKGEKSEIIPVDWKKLLESGDTKNPIIRPGDRICIKGAMYEPPRAASVTPGFGGGGGGG